MTVPERVMSTEIEYALLDQTRRSQIRVPDITEKQLDEYLPEGVRNSGQYLTNGARRYKDVGAHPEYAGPECLGPKPATLHEIAGEHVLYALVAGLKLQGRNVVGNKRLSDGVNGQWGAHLNFEIEREFFNELIKGSEVSERLLVLATHLATSAIYFGSGMYAKNGQYFLSQRRTVTDLLTTNTVKQKALINTRDEPHHGGADDRARLHVQGGMANMNPWGTFMQLGTMSALLRVMEDDRPLDLPILKDPHVAAMIVARDVDLEEELELADGSTLPANDIQKEYAHIARKADDDGVLSEQESQAVDEWESIADDLPNRERVDCTRRVEWLLRRELVERDVERWPSRDKSKTLPDQKKRRNNPIGIRRELDFMYDRLGPDGLGWKLRDRDYFALGFSDEEVAHAVRVPPPTRAQTRAEIIDAACKRGRHIIVNWGTVKSKNGAFVHLGRADTHKPEIVRRAKERIIH